MIGLLIAAALAAQSTDAATDGWDVTTNDEHGVVASSAWSSGQAVLVRCKAGRLNVMVDGLPPVDARFRNIEMTLGGVGPETQPWKTAPGAALFAANEPARIARLMTGGGELRLRIPDTVTGDGPTYALLLPSNGDGIRQVLRACDQPLEGEYDHLLRLSGEGVRWLRAPPPIPPSAARLDFKHGEVELECLVNDDGRPFHCRVERETPPNSGLAPAAMASMRNGRLVAPNDGRTGARVINFTMSYNFD